MSSPREAVYDVLLTKRQRGEREKARAAKAQEEWERYEADNGVAHATYMGQRSDGKPNGRAKP